MTSDLLSLKWNNHNTSFYHLLLKLCMKESHSDTTIVCQGKYFPAHKLVLCSCSKYFEEIFEQAQCKHPFIIINDLDPLEFEALMKYMYRGEVSVPQNRLPALIRAAEALNIKGLAIPDDDDPQSSEVSSVNKRKRKFSGHSLDSKRKRKSPTENLEAPNELQHCNNSEHEDPEQTHLACSEESFKEESSELHSVLLKKLSQSIPVCSEEGMNIKDEPLEEICQDEGRYRESDHNSIDNISEPFSTSNPIQPPFVDQYPPDIRTEGLFYHIGVQNTSPSDAPLEREVASGVRDDQQQVLISALSGPKGERLTFRCHFCSYMSFNRTHTINHMRRHTGEKPFACPQCFKRFSLKHNLDRHFKSHR